VGKDKDTPLGSTGRELDERVGPRVDHGRRFPAGTTVLEELPVRVGFVDLTRGQALVFPVVNLPQQIGELGVREAGELRGASRALERARVDVVELDPREPATKVVCVLLTARSKRKVGRSGVLS
jgi:hypothetical protein